MSRPSPSPWDKALDLLSRRPHLRRELGAKLSSRGYDAEEIESTLARLEERRFLDDESAARAFVEARLRRGPEGSARLRAELERRGADRGLASRVVAELVDDDDRAAAREAARRFRSTRRSAEPSTTDRERARLARHLERKGFSSRAILAALEDDEV